MSQYVHRPSGRMLWSLVESAAVHRSRRGRIAVDGAWGWVEPTDQDAPVPEVLRRMTLGPVALENVAALQDDHLLWRAGAPNLRVWLRIKDLFDELGGYVVPSLADHGGGPPLLSLVPTGAVASFRMPVMTGSTRYAAVATTRRSIGDDGPALRGAGSAYAAVLHRREPDLVAAALLAGPAGGTEIAAATGVAEPMVEDVVAYLAASGLVAPLPAR